MPNSPQVSIVMGTYNEEENIRSSVQSILDQTFEDFEFIIIDDGSTDRTVEILQTFDDERLRIFRNESNCGLTRTLNRGIKASKGEFIARMDADDKSLPKRLEQQVAWLQNSEAMAVTSWYRIRGRDGDWICDQRIPTDRSFGIGDLIAESQAIAHGSVMLRRSALETVGGYCERYTLSQDRDLWFRLASEFGSEFIGVVAEVLYEYSAGPEDFVKRPTQSFYGSYATLRAAIRSLPRDDAPHEFDRPYLQNEVDDANNALPKSVAESRYWEFVGNALLRRGEIGQGYRCLGRALRADLRNVRAWYRLLQPILKFKP